MAIRVLTDTIGNYPSLLDPTRTPVDLTLHTTIGTDNFQTKSDLESKPYTSIEEKLGVRIHIGQPIGWSSFVDVNGVLSQGSKSIENQRDNTDMAAFNRFVGEYAGMETPLYYSGVGLNPGIDLTIKRKKVDFGFGLYAKLGIRGVGLQNQSPSGISRAVVGRSWGVGLRFSIKPHLIPFHPTDNTLANAPTTPTSGGNYQVIGFAGDEQYHRIRMSGIMLSHC